MLRLLRRRDRRARGAPRRRAHVDVKPSRAKEGLHYQGDVRVILFSRPWRRVFAFPPCDHLAFSGSQYFESKLAAGLSWYGLSFAALCYCAPAEIVVMENSRGLLGACWRREAQVLQPHEFGLGRSGRAETKATPIWRRGVYHDVLPTDPRPPPYYGANHAASGEQRDVSDPNLVRALVQQYPPSGAVAHPRPVFAVEVARAAAGFTARFGAQHLPAEWQHPLAVPPPAAQHAAGVAVGDIVSASMRLVAGGADVADAAAAVSLELWRRCTAGTGWQNLASDQLIPTPRFFFGPCFHS